MKEKENIFCPLYYVRCLGRLEVLALSVLKYLRNIARFLVLQAYTLKELGEHTASGAVGLEQTPSHPRLSQISHTSQPKGWFNNTSQHGTGSLSEILFTEKSFFIFTIKSH